MGSPHDYDHLLDATAVARMVGLQHRNSVAAYARRYVDFPAPVVVRSAGRTRLWDRADIAGWLARTSATQRRRTESSEANRSNLITAARAMMARRPISDISVREISAAAGVPHAVIYRSFGSKQDLRFAVIDQCVADLNRAVAGVGYTPAEMPQVVRVVFDQAEAIRVIVFGLMEGDPRAAQFRSPPLMGHLADAIRERRDRAAGGIGPETAAAAVASLLVGWIVFKPRIDVVTGTGHDPDDVARILSAIISMA
ncbi:MAG: TetR/AcrR family transcriptional regulator [Candidatus Nanopelagicales bacterium]